MDVSWEFTNRKCVRLLAAFFTQRVTTAHMNRGLALQVREAKIHAPVAAEGRTKQTEKCLVLIDGQELPVAQRPTFGGEAKAKNSDFREKWFCHDFLLPEVKLECAPSND